MIYLSHNLSAFTMETIINHVSSDEIGKRVLSTSQFDLLVSNEGYHKKRVATSTLDIKLMYSSLYISYMDLCKTCQPSSKWTILSNIDFITKAGQFVSELERCIHMGVPRSGIMRSAIVLMTGAGTVVGEEYGQDWGGIIGGKFFDWVAYRASCVGNEIIGMTDEMYHALSESPETDLVSKARSVLLVPLSDLTNMRGYCNDLKLARNCYSVSHRIRSIFRQEGPYMRDIARVLEAVLGEWVVGQTC